MIYFRGTKDIHLDHTVVALGKFGGCIGDTSF